MKGVIMKERFNYIRQLIINNNISGNTTDHYLWSLCCVDYFYYDGNIRPTDIKNHWTDAPHDGEIDYVYYTKDSNDVYLIQGKSQDNLNFKDIKNIFRTMADTVKDFEEEKEIVNKYNQKLIKTYQRGMVNKTRKDITLVLFTNTNITEGIRKQLESWEDKEFKVEVYGRDQIEAQEVNVVNGEKTVEKGYLECADSSVIKYSNENNSGIILSIKASSLQDLYQQESDNGLFGYNLREQINDNRLHVDEGIIKTIKTEKDNFWFYNNGITIACDSYRIQDGKLYLNNFSIINGAQTTTIIGNSEDITSRKDFSIVCKVVRSPGSLDNSFVKRISIASNSQKEIEPRDLYSNSQEQIQLQYRCRTNKYPLAVTIKRGVKPSNHSQVQKWQKIENNKLGQIILAALLQKPGTARNQPNCIFTDKDIYESIFGIKVVTDYNYNALYDIVRLQNSYEKYKTKLIKQKEKDRAKETKDVEKIRKLQDEIGILKNSGYTVISIITYLIKRKYFDLSRISGTNDESWAKFVNKKIDTNLSINNTSKNYKKNLEELFESIVTILFKLYDDEVSKPDSTVNNPSNYFKRDEIYRKNIIKAFDNLIENDSNNTIFKNLEIFNDTTNKEN